MNYNKIIEKSVPSICLQQCHLLPVAHCTMTIQDFSATQDFSYFALDVSTEVW
uniref:Uncharacterized protein n=2 Tax=Anguilla anguilla TaxID=7936 RepID=A0A0E9UCP6_ANGAN